MKDPCPAGQFGPRDPTVQEQTISCVQGWRPRQLTQEIGKATRSDRKVSRRIILPSLTERDVVPTNNRENWFEAHIKSSGADDNVGLVLGSIGGPQAILGEGLDFTPS
jgi:hypothetical protein